MSTLAIPCQLEYGCKSERVPLGTGFCESRVAATGIGSLGGVADLSNEWGIRSEESRTSTRSSLGRELIRPRGMMASDASSATLAIKIRRAGWRQASIARTTTLKNRIADKAASKVSVSIRSQALMIEFAPGIHAGRKATSGFLDRAQLAAWRPETRLTLRLVDHGA